MLRSAATMKANEQKETPLDADAIMDSKFTRHGAVRSQSPDATSRKTLEKPFRARLVKG